MWRRRIRAAPPCTHTVTTCQTICRLCRAALALSAGKSLFASHYILSVLIDTVMCSSGTRQAAALDEQVPAEDPDQDHQGQRWRRLLLRHVRQDRGHRGLLPVHTTTFLFKKKIPLRPGRLMRSSCVARVRQTFFFYVQREKPYHLDLDHAGVSPHLCRTCGRGARCAACARRCTNENKPCDSTGR